MFAKTLALAAIAAVTYAQIDEAVPKPAPATLGRRAYCKMHHDPTNSTTLPYGYFKLYQASPASDVLIKGEMW